MIPSHGFFIWYGPSLPWTARLAILSAAKNSGLQKFTLYHEGLKENSPEVLPLRDLPSFELVKITPEIFSNESFLEVGDLYPNLSAPAARSNLVRLALLYSRGGVYLDTDTITLKSFSPLMRYQGFCGVEPVALPAGLFHSVNPLGWMKAGSLLLARDLCARVAGGHSLFLKIQPWFSRCVNNAVVGSVPGNPLLARAFEIISEMESEEKYKRFRLGTHLLQNITGNVSGPHMEVLDGEVFYPLGPEISNHLFLPGSASRLKALIPEHTLSVHWYQSVYSRLYPEGISFEEIAKQKSAFAVLAEPYREALK